MSPAAHESAPPLQRHGELLLEGERGHDHICGFNQIKFNIIGSYRSDF
jgi:hypothetical protein